MSTGVSKRRFQFNTVDSLVKFFGEIAELRDSGEETWQLDFDKVALWVTIKNHCNFDMEDLISFDHYYEESAD